MRKLTAVLVAAALLAACSEEDDPATTGTTGTCDQIAAFSGCTEYEDLPPELAAQLEVFCVEEGLGTWSNAPCPSEGRTGICSWVETGVTIHDGYYDAATAAADEQACVDGGGTWTPG
jgi:major membrane immunogen (membrane-anchored lipoprotein)